MFSKSTNQVILSQLIILLILSISSVTIAQATRRTVSIHTWTACRDLILLSYKDDPCSETEEFKDALNEFNDSIFPGAYNTSEECENYYRKQQHEYKSQDPVNRDNHFENCFCDKAIQTAAKRDECFYRIYYQPIYEKCSGLGGE